MFMDNKKKTINLYKGNIRVWFFTIIRFWTGSFSKLDKYIPKSGTIIDLGSGYGIFSNYLALLSPKRTIVGVDTDIHKISQAYKGITNTSFKTGDATKMKFKNVAGVIIHDVLHHLNSYQEQENLVKDCKNMLKKDGILLIVEVDKKPIIKWILGRIADFIMYKGEPVRYRYRKEMINMLTKYFTVQNISIKQLQSSPFAQVAYICKKHE